jgi:hypothetical protein
VLIDIFDICTKKKIVKEEIEELLLNVVATCNNISFYLDVSILIFTHFRIIVVIAGTTVTFLMFSQVSELVSSSESSELFYKRCVRIKNKWIVLSEQITECLFHENEHIILEAIRTIGIADVNLFVEDSLSSFRSCYKQETYQGIFLF